MKYEKMSKSRGNVVLPDEVVHGVCDLAPGYEFRDAEGQVVDWQKISIWRAEDGYRTATRFGRCPVFLHEKDNPVPCLLLLKGKEVVQHAWFLDYWIRMLKLYEEVSPAECPKEGCFHWVCPGGAADVSGKTHASVEDALKNGEWKSFPEGACVCSFGKCIRLHPDGKADLYEPCDCIRLHPDDKADEPCD